MIESHRRHLPHWYAVGKTVFLTWRLHGTLPVGRSFPEALTSGQAFAAIDRLLDHASVGPRFMARTEIAAIVADAILSRDRRHYQLHACVVMPNHVHLLITPLTEVWKVVQSPKRFTSRECNKILGRTGHAFWQDESYDRLVRDDLEFVRIARYTEINPVRAGSVSTSEEFLWSSAGPIADRPQVDNPPHVDLGG